MPHEIEKRRPGRPRAYHRETALRQAADVFWAKGLSGTSLDEIAAATAMNRPSLAAAFGGKEDLYLETLERYRDDGVAALRETLFSDRPLGAALAEVYRRATEQYLAGRNAAQGCLLIGTASVEAVENARIRSMLAESLARFEAVFAERLHLASGNELPAGSEPEALAQVGVAVLHSLAVRARAGEDRAALDRLAETAVAMIVGHGRTG